MPRNTIYDVGRSREGEAPFVRLPQLRKVRDCRQVAAVCYRIRNGAIEFLLVRTRGSGRWTFPKGSAEPGLTHAQAAALEAFEEAGVHGRIEEVSFAHYIRRKQADRTGAAEKAIEVSAHLCEVRRLGPAQEARRKRTWFAAEEARQRLAERRKPHDRAEFTRVVNRAMERIGDLYGLSAANRRAAQGQFQENAVVELAIDDQVTINQDPLNADGLNKVLFEAAAEFRRATSVRSRLSEGGGLPGRAIEMETGTRREVLPCEILPFNSARNSSRIPRWLANAKRTRALGAGAKDR